MNKGEYGQRFTDKKLVEYYEEKEYGHGEYYALIWSIEKEILKGALKSRKDKDLDYLDFACGTGRVLSFVEKYTKNSKGIDISNEMLKIAKERTSKSSLEKRDILKDPLVDKYDLITSFRFFLNTEDDLRDKILIQLRDSLKEDGLLIFSIQGNTFSFRSFTLFFNNLFRKKRKMKQMSFGDVENMLKRGGMRVVRCYGIGLLPKPLYKLRLLRKCLFSLDRGFSKVRLLGYVSHTLVFLAEKK